jgi:hypothetical protein
VGSGPDPEEHANNGLGEEGHSADLEGRVGDGGGLGEDDNSGGIFGDKGAFKDSNGSLKPVECSCGHGMVPGDGEYELKIC